MKHGVEGNPDDFTLSQLLPDKGTTISEVLEDDACAQNYEMQDMAGSKTSTFSELQIPPKANVYYAINTQHDLNFVLKRKTSTEGAADLLKGSTSTSTPGRKRDTSKARRKLLGLALWPAVALVVPFPLVICYPNWEYYDRKL